MVRVTETQFADVALYTGSRGRRESVAKMFVEEAKKWELAVSMKKTNEMAVGVYYIFS